jgi:hypothetical protein
MVYNGYIDLREDKHYLADHPGLVPVTTAQVWFLPLAALYILMFGAIYDTGFHILRVRNSVNRSVLHII